MLTTGNSWLSSTLKANAGEVIAYSRGVISTEGMTVTRGRTAFETTDTDGFIITSHSVDWLILASDLVLDGEVVLPDVRDYVTDSDGRIYTVLILPGGTHYRFQDPQQTMLRIHTRMKYDGRHNA